MATSVTVHKAKTDLSRLIAKAEAGEEVVICRRDRPVARLTAIAPARRPDRVLGRLAHLGPVPPEALEPFTDDCLGLTED